MNKDIVEVLKKMAEYEQQFNSQFAIGIETGEFLFNKVLEVKAKSILELGTWRGASAIYMAAALQDIGAGKIVTVDSDSIRNNKFATDNLVNAGLDSFVDFVNADITDYLKNDTNKYDLIFMDAAKKRTLSWLKQLIGNNVHQSTLIIIDDVTSMKDQMEDVYQYLDESVNFDYQVLPIEDGLMLIKTKM